MKLSEKLEVLKKLYDAVCHLYKIEDIGAFEPRMADEIEAGMKEKIEIEEKIIRESTKRIKDQVEDIVKLEEPDESL